MRIAALTDIAIITAINSPFFVLPALGFILMYIWSMVKPSVTARKVVQKECCKEA
ncbi:MAG: hypothetical protein WBP58_15765 [Chitinophagaceae bacterium]